MLDEPKCFKAFAKTPEQYPPIGTGSCSPFSSVRTGVAVLKQLDDKDMKKVINRLRAGRQVTPDHIVEANPELLKGFEGKATLVQKKRKKKKTSKKVGTVQGDAKDDKITEQDSGDSDTDSADSSSEEESKEFDSTKSHSSEVYVPIDAKPMAYEEQWDDVCVVCNVGGDLLTCTYCRRVTHYGERDKCVETHFS